MSWTDERIDRLKEYWSKGMTASQIADELGGVSRNAVIGKAHRLGLQSRPSPVKPNEPAQPKGKGKAPPAAAAAAEVAPRSEEHTSELQSLMRISYAVFCLKKKKKQIKYNNIHNIRLSTK